MAIADATVAGFQLNASLSMNSMFENSRELLVAQFVPHRNRCPRGTGWKMVISGHISRALTVVRSYAARHRVETISLVDTFGHHDIHSCATGLGVIPL